MGLLSYFKKDQLTEEIKAFEERPKPKITDILAKRGEGWENTENIDGVGQIGVQSFNLFYNNYINKQYENEVNKINFYRQMANMPEIADVIEDAVNESTQVNEDNLLVHLEIKDKKLSDNENILKNLNDEFHKLFNENINTEDELWNMFRNYFIDGRVYYERIIDKRHPKNGIINIKILPSETMDYIYNPLSGQIISYFQYLKLNSKRPQNIEEARSREDIVLFNTNQIGFINYGIFGKSKYEIFGFLEKSKVPYNQLKLLETSVIIYRIIRAPERFVFRIDTGNMPRDKALKYVEKIKKKMSKKQSYNSSTGELSQEPEILSMLENYYLPQCLRLNTFVSLLDGRNITLKNLIEEHNEGKKHEVYSVDQKTGKIIRGKVKWAGITRKNAKLVRVWLDNNEYLDVTPDHKFVMRDGKEIEAQNLKENNSLMPLYLRKEKINTKSNNYMQVFDSKFNEWKFVHRILGPLQKKGNAIHHKDFDKYNNMEDNLDSMLIKEHIKLHYMSNVERQSHIPLLKGLNKPENRAKQKQAAKEYQLKRWSDPEERQKMSEYTTNRHKNNKEYSLLIKEVFSRPKTNKHKENLRKSTINYFSSNKGIERKNEIGEESKKRWEDKTYKEHMSKVKSSIINDKVKRLFISEFIKNFNITSPKFIDKLSNGKFMKYWIEINKNIKAVNKNKLGKDSFYKIIRSLGFNNFIEFKQNFVNHKVVKIEYLTEREDTGCLTIKDSGDNHNFGLSCGIFVKNSAEGRGSQIETVGGNSAGFSELDDIYYFARKLYRALKYPSSRVSAGQEKSEGDILFGGGSTGEISRDEIKWSKFLERQQRKFCKELTNLFLIHLEFKGLKKQYDLNERKINVVLNPPSKYKEQMEANFIESRHNNYSSLADREEMSKYYCMKKYLKWSDEEIQENRDGMKKDIEYGFKEENDSGY